MHIHQKRTAHRGFTLLEMIVVLILLTLFAGILAPVAGTVIMTAKIEKTRDDLDALEKAVGHYFEDTEAFPPNLWYLQREVTPVAGWSGAYLLPTAMESNATENNYIYDRWKTAYTTQLNGPDEFVIMSYGPNRTFNGGGDDITRVVTVAPIKRAKTLEELRIINEAIGYYNKNFYNDSDAATYLSASWPATLSKLRNKGLLAPPPQGNIYQNDAWGAEYNSSLFFSAPGKVDKVVSDNVGS